MRCWVWRKRDSDIHLRRSEERKTILKSSRLWKSDVELGCESGTKVLRGGVMTGSTTVEVKYEREAHADYDVDGAGSYE